MKSESDKNVNNAEPLKTPHTTTYIYTTPLITLPSFLQHLFTNSVLQTLLEENTG